MKHARPRLQYIYLAGEIKCHYLSCNIILKCPQSETDFGNIAGVNIPNLNIIIIIHIIIYIIIYII